MRLQTRTWCVISVLCFAAGIYLWKLAEKYEPAGKPGAANAASPSNAPAPPSGPKTNSLLGITPAPNLANLSPPSTPSHSPSGAHQRLPADLLSNTAKSLDQLVHSDDAVLLRNAFVETTAPLELGIPAHLRAKGDPGSYIVQSRGLLDDAFRAELRRAGAEIISYVPNNAYLVRLSASGANQLAALPRTQTVMPYEPYYKLDESLLALARDQKPLPEEVRIKVTLFPGERDVALKAVADLGAQVLGEDRSPFGPQLIVQPAADSLVALAQLPVVQGLERAADRVLLNDLTRVQLGVAVDTMAKTNYLGLSGSNVVVNVNDSGVDQDHPDLTGRVLPPLVGATGDPEGHGTHVAGVIASSGDKSSTVTNVFGSLTNASFRGLAPQARLFPLSVSLGIGPFISDALLQETAAATNWVTMGRTNAMISNNSWGYNNVQQYDSAAASYDAAVRDALPGVTGSQPLVYVFAAGDNGAGADNGQGGEQDTVVSPATAKNVITVGAIEHPRNITNEVVTTDQGNSVTNQPFLGLTDSSTEVAGFSSRGNVGIGLEGSSGRFKPDVVAPGTFVVSTRSSGFKDPTGSTKLEVQNFPGLVLSPENARDDVVDVLPNAVQLIIRALSPGTQVPATLEPLEIYVKQDAPPADTDLVGTNVVLIPPALPLVPGALYYYRIRNQSAFAVPYDLQTVQILTNANEAEFAELQKLNAGLGPYYRYASGTSVAAPAVSGLLALMQEYFEQNHLAYSPALMKALLINGARSVDPKYSFTVNNDVNYQGWGLVNLPTSLPPNLQDGTNANSSVWYFDQSPERALATGQRLTWNLQVDPSVGDNILRFTLVWTDPPGNPNVAVKLVNDLDLVVTNLDTGEIFQGNNIPFESDFTQPNTTNSVVPSDSVNNVENVFFRSTGTNYSITVLGRRVNVNAVTAHTNDIVQDFALVISAGDGTLTNAFTLTPLKTVTEAPQALLLTNGVPFLAQRVGANSPLLDGTNGTAAQWSFYVFTNNFNQTNLVGITNGQNVAFISFFPPNLSRPRNVDADIDLYVSRDQANGVKLLELDPAVVAAADKSTKRGGTEVVFYTNSFDGEVFYIGVKSEDQQASEFGLVGLSTALPFDEMLNGKLEVRFFPFNANIPDGSPVKPEAALLFGVATRPVQMQNVVAYNTLTHEQLGDLVGNLSHENRFVVLNNHRVGSPTNTLFIYDDSNQGFVAGTQSSDGPGSLNNFMGEYATGAWQFTMIDNSPTHTGVVNSLRLVITPAPPPTDTIFGSVLPGRFAYFFVDVPVDATNLTVVLSAINPGVSLDLYARRGDLPTQIFYDKFALITPPGGQLTITPDDVPPLNAGRYFIGVFNPSSQTVNFQLKFLIGRNLATNLGQIYASTDTPLPILDDAVTLSTINVPTNRILNSVEVAVRLDHPRISDLALRLVSPLGTRVLLAEDRGRTNATAYGAGDLPDAAYTIFTENTNRASVPIKFAAVPFTPPPPAEPLVFSSFEGVAATNYLAGETVDGWLVETNFVTVLTNAFATDGTNVLSSSQARISRLLPTVAGREYVLRFAYRSAAQGLFNTGVNDDARPLPLGSVDPHYELIESADSRYPASVGNPGAASVVSNHDSVDWLTNNAVSQWIGPTADQGSDPMNVRFPASGTYIYRTTFDLGARDPATATIQGALTVDIRLENIRLNGRSTGIRYDIAAPQNELSPQFTIGSGFTNGLNTLDFVTYNGSGPTGMRTELRLDARFRSSTNAPLQVELDGVLTNALTPGFLWQTNEIDFFAPTNGTPAAIAVDQAEVRIDSFVVRDVVDTYFLPEEPLAPLAGENAAGPWKLEVWDTRLGPGGQPDPALLSWQLRMKFVVPTPEAVNLTTNGCFSDTVAGDTIKYFYVEVPRSATMAINTLERITGSGDLELLYRVAGVPSGTVPPDDLDQNSNNFGTDGGELLVLTRNSTPPLLPGQRYYLGVRSATPAAGTNAFKICVQFDRIDNVILLTNAVPYFNTIAAGSKLDYYQFNVLPNAYRVTYDLLPANGNADLFARLQVLPQPTPNLYDYASTNPGTNADQIVVTPASVPVPLTSGAWYLGVLNSDLVDVTYSIVATQLTNEINVIDLTNCVPVDFVVDTNTVVTNFFHFAIDQNNPALEFDLYNLSDSGELIFAQNATPVPRGTFADGNRPAKLLFLTNSLLPSLNGDWYLAVLNHTPTDARTNLSFTIKACLTDTNLVVIPLTNHVTYSNTVPVTFYGIPAVDYYQFTVSPNALYADFEVLAKYGDVELILSQGVLPTAQTNQYSARDPAASNLLIRIDADSSPVPLTPGDWFIGVVNRDVVPVTYSVRATEYSVITLTNGVPYAKTIPPGRFLDYYQFEVSSNATQAVFEFLQGGDQVGLFVRKHLPLPNPGNFQYTTVEPPTLSVTLGPTSWPEPLSPGLWYLSVTNLTTNVVSYVIRATESVATETKYINPEIIITDTNLCLRWPSELGWDYVAQGKATIVDPAWTNLTVSLPGTGGVMEFCLSRPTDLSFFQIVATRGVQPPVSIIEFPVIVASSSNVCLTWPTVPGTQYLVQARTNITDPGWVDVPPPVTAVSTSYTYCIDFPTDFRFFQIAVLGTTSAPPVITLTNGVGYTNTITKTGNLDYYRFNVSSNAELALFELVQFDGLVDFFLHPGLPLPGPSNSAYDTLGQTNTAKYVRVTTNSSPVALTPGDWYLAVTNRDSQDVSYVIRATEVVPVLTGTTNYLEPGLLVTNASLCLNWAAGPGTNYFVQGKTNIVEPAWGTLPNGGPLTTPIQTNLEYCLTLPTPYQFFQVLAISGGVPVTTNQVVGVVPDNQIVGQSVTPTSFCLTWVSAAGTNYVVQGLTNVTDTPWVNVSALILATGTNSSYCLTLPTPFQFFQVAILSAAGPPQPQIITLTNGVVYTRTNAAPAGLDYYRFSVSTNAQQAEFKLVQSSGSADFYVRQGEPPLPGPLTYDYTSTPLPATNKAVVVLTNSEPVPLRAGDWYLAVTNRDSQAVTYEVLATETIPAVTGTTNILGAPYPLLTFTSSNLCLSWPAGSGTNYYVQGRTNIVQPGWETLDGPLTTPTNTTLEYCLPLTTDYRFFQILAVSGGTPPQPEVVVLSNGVGYTNRIGTEGNLDYYRFNVSSNAELALFELVQFDGLVDFFLHPGLPLPGPGNSAYDTLGQTNTAKYVRVTTNSSPVALTPGDWYLAVTNRDSQDVSYVIRATEVVPVLTGTPNYLEPGLLVTNSSLCLNWAAGPGTNYFVQGKTNIVEPAWRTLPNGGPLTAAVTTNLEYCLTLPTEYQFFQILAVSGGAPPPTTNEVIGVVVDKDIVNQSVSLTNYCLTWVSIPGTNYVVEGLTNVTDAVWANVSPVLLATSTNTSYCVEVPTPFQFFQVAIVRPAAPPPPEIIVLTNGVGYTRTNAAPGSMDYYRFTVSTNAERAEFKLVQFSGLVDCYLRQGQPPLPGPLTYDYTSTALPLTNKSVVVLTNSQPVPLGAGDWYLSVTNQDSKAVTYEILASETMPVVTGTTNYLNPGLSVTNGLLCLSWAAGPGTNYYVQAKTDIVQPASQTLIGPLTTPTATTLEHCLPVPTNTLFFQIMAVSGGAPEPIPPEIGVASLTYTNSGFTLSWTAPVGQRFQVDYANAVPPAWKSFTNIVTSTNGRFTFTDDGSQSGGLEGFRIYQLRVVP